MADRILTPQKPSASGIAMTRVTALLTADTHIVRNNGSGTLLIFEKTGAGACIVTVQTPAQVGGLDVAEQTFTVPATTGYVATGPFPRSVYNDGVDDLRFTVDEVTGLTVVVLQV